MNILIFYGAYGGGHLSAAKSIKEYIDENYLNTKVKLVDCIQYTNKFYNKISTIAYSEMAKKAPKLWGTLYFKSEKGTLSRLAKYSNNVMSLKLNKLLKSFKPDLIISTHPFSSNMCAFLKKYGNLNCKIATVLTDYHIHSQWLNYSDYVDYYFVAHIGMKNALLTKGVDEFKIFSTGIPLSNRFLANYNKQETLESFGLELGKTTVLFFAGGEFGLGKNKTLDVLKSLIENYKDIQIIAIAGRNVKIKEQFEDLVRSNNRVSSVKILEYTDKVPELMSVSDLVITKPGGLTTTESLASGLPIIVINPIPGQEEENAEFLENNNVAIWIKKNDNIKESLEKIFNDPERLSKMKINARLLAKRNSTKDICSILLD